MENLKLEYPNIKYKDSYLESLKNFHKENRNLDENIIDLTTNFTNFVNYLMESKLEKARERFDGCVPETFFWLIKDDTDYIGRVSIRHDLTELLLKEGGHIGYDICPTKRNKGYGYKILELGLIEAKKMGLNKVLLTCNSDNIGSKKIIEKNKGIFENEIESKSGKKLRYWIYL